MTATPSTSGVVPQASRLLASPDFDAPVALPRPRGLMSYALISILRRPPGVFSAADLVWTGSPVDVLSDDDLQLSLFLTYELHYRGLAAVGEDWEWNPQLVEARQGWEQVVLRGLSAAVGSPQRLAQPDAPSTVRRLFEIAGDDRGPTVSTYLMEQATRLEFSEFLAHCSVNHVEKADAYAWARPRLSGSVKAALIALQSDQDGGGRSSPTHAQLFRSLLRGWGLDPTYGHYLDRVPGVTLLATNLISLFGLNRRLRGALVGHLARSEMTSSTRHDRYARGHRRLGGDDETARFFDEHVVAGSVRTQLAAHELAGGLVTQEPVLAGDVVFGALCSQLADELLAAYLLPRWQRGSCTLRSTPRAGAARLFTS